MGESIDFKTVRFLAADGYQLSGSYFPAADPPEGMPVLICPATGVRQSFYYAFSRWLSKEGYSVLVFDYRGVGSSLAESHVKKSKVRKQDWGELDMPAALEWLLKKTGASQAVLIGHSAGAQLVGLMPNHESISHLIAVSASSGYVGNIKYPTRLAAMFFTYFYIPLAVRVLGYAPAKWIGWGEDLPPMVALQWARWCRTPGYLESDFGVEVEHDFYKELTCPVTLFSADDDPLATKNNVNDWLRLMPLASKEIVHLRPHALGCDPIGHVNMFRSSRGKVWPLLLSAIKRRKEK
ncbi:alpha/beta hydrolase family protein [Halomonas salipaludis]|uniref:Alpha/beta hydrolase n=1 Tax=Halomonas salipaludis TaxID=2032625 RepID=A0A2A2F1A2_9GAMM|nr:alpha/beta fold hydrolase [Halomonas salipaludis]PAU78372.1 alpha/beta hydrolase [Halomonas salipaludis]